jgi:hypothetical protein
MAKSPFENSPLFAKLSEDSRKAVTQAFDAMAEWRGQVNEMGEKNSTAVFDKMAEAAKALGWPTEFVELSRQQVQNATKMQSQMIEQVMGTWEQQLTNPGQPLQMPQMPSIPGFPSMGGGSSSPFGMFPGFGDSGATPMMPMQLWMQAAEMWQKSWQQAMNSWVETQNKAMGGK